MSERIYKLQPDRTIQLRGFNDLGASAALHSATGTGFKVTGTFRDPADFCVLTLYDCDNYYEHPSLKYLPDTNFDGLKLEFDVHYTGLRSLDSPRHPITDWDKLDIIRADNTRTTIPLFNANNKVSGAWTPATAQFTILTAGLREWDHLTLCFLNHAFDYLVPPINCGFDFLLQGAGSCHSITVAGNTYSYTEQETDLDSNIAAQIVAAMSADPLVTASRGDNTPENGSVNQVNLVARPGNGQEFTVSASAGGSFTLHAVSAQSIAADLAGQCNNQDWSGVDIPITAAVENATITFMASKPGVDGNALSIYAVAKNAHLTASPEMAQFSGGASDATWHVTIDFAAHQAKQIRRMWLTFAPPISIGQPFQSTEWEAVFSNWTVTGPEEVRRLQVAGPGSFRLEDTNTACAYTGDWPSEAGFYSRGYAKVSKQTGNTVSILYQAALTHDLWLGTSLYGDRGSATLMIDGVSVNPDFSTRLDTELDPAVITRREIARSIAPGEHTVVIRTNDAGPFYFDFLEIAVPSDIPASLPPRTNISPALDYSTDHTYKLPPARILWMFDKLGFAGPMNEYIGVFWWNQRQRTGAVIPRATLTFAGEFQYGDQVWLIIGDTRIGKSVLPADTNDTIALHFACYVNAIFVGLWATASANVVTLTSHSPTKDFQFNITPSVESVATSTGTVTIDGVLRYPESEIETGQWIVDTVQTPVLNRGARDWHADFFRECAARNRELTVASSMELVLPPDRLPARFYNGDPVRTDVGYGSDWHSAQCAFNTAMFAYQQQVYSCLAGLMTAAGLVPNLQFGEFGWWFKASVSPEPSMAFYDAETKAAAEAALDGPLARFESPADDPLLNEGADAAFLRNRLRDYVAALIASVRAQYPNAKFEVLFPYDVNYPQPAGVHQLGGRLLRFVNFPSEWEQKATSGFDRLKMEGLDWGSSSRDLDLAKDVMEFPIQLGWPLDSIRYMLPVFNGGCPWISEYRLADDLGIPAINLWAFDHVCLFGLKVTEPSKPARAFRF